MIHRFSKLLKKFMANQEIKSEINHKIIYLIIKKFQYLEYMYKCYKRILFTYVREKIFSNIPIQSFKKI